VGLGINKIRVTGGEPLVRKGVVDFIARITTLPGVEDVSLTTNGVLLERYVTDLWAAGLRRLNVSLDSLRRDRYAELTRRDDFPVVQKSIQAALTTGFNPLKINCVVVRGINDDEVFDFVEWAALNSLFVRFIEFMPMGGTPWERTQVVPGAEILARLKIRFPLVAESMSATDDPARHIYRVEGTRGRVGFINTISQPFCGACSRLRITSQGTIRPCLLNDLELDLKPFLGSDESLAERIMNAVGIKPPRHYVNDPDTKPVQVAMADVGG
jgi:cyclic pyranopterin phosphate synthase